MRRRPRKRQEKREDRPVLKRLRAILQGDARRKNGLCEWSARDNWDPR